MNAHQEWLQRWAERWVKDANAQILSLESDCDELRKHMGSTSVQSEIEAYGDAIEHNHLSLGWIREQYDTLKKKAKRKWGIDLANIS